MTAERCCPTCGTSPWDPAQPCPICCYRGWRELAFVRGDGITVAFGRLATHLGQAWARASLGEEGSFWDANRQMTLEPSAGTWWIVPNLDAPNDTIIDGARLQERLELQDGMRLAVGRASKGILKTPVTVRLT